ncbi:MAG: PEP/pyruvate-binding domain-containing protein [bacterium]
MSTTTISGSLPEFSTGIPSLDTTLQSLIAGDNVVWQVNDIENYSPFVDNFIRHGLTTGAPLVYFRFAKHRQLVPETPGIDIHHVDPEAGFEKFVGEILNVIEANGRGALYVFDGLSELAADWYSDRMLGNFFMITCPFLFKLDTIAYFALFNKRHSFHAVESIHQTAQVVLDVYRNREHLFVQPVKVDKRHSPTMYTLHVWGPNDEFSPVTSSTTISDILSQTPQPWLDFSTSRPGIWMKTVSEAQKTLEAIRNGTGTDQNTQNAFHRLLRSAITRDDKFMPLAEKYFDLADLMAVIQRMIGTGLIGGKSLGMLLARAILKKQAPSLYEILESHDSFFIGSDVFYTYLVQNECWDLRRKANDLNFLIEHNDEAQHKLLSGKFPDTIRRQFMEMLDYFGQCPIIVRSSSLLEDSYGNAFSGKYDTVFCANQGTPQQRLAEFMSAVRTVYASTLSVDALSYRAQRGLLDRDEQMSLLIQRVSGELHGGNFFPQVAGAGFSFNPYVWDKDIDPSAGMLRLVFGLGTRAVDRLGDDYTRLIALNAPEKRPDASAGDIRKFSQRQADVLDLPRNQLMSKNFNDVVHPVSKTLPLDLFAVEEGAPGGREQRYYLTFDRLIRETHFVNDMRVMLRQLQDAYDYPVDMEFTANFTPDGDYRINLLQCRPFQVRIAGDATDIRSPDSIRKENLLMESSGPIIGQSTSTNIDRLIYIIPSLYGQMSVTERYAVARTIGKLNRMTAATPGERVMIVGPGRWATSTPALGVPVSFSEINAVSVICEIGVMHEGLVPDVSLGTHFFNDLVEMDMLYLAILPDRKGHLINPELLASLPNKLTTLLPGAEALSGVVRVIDGTDLPHASRLRLYADSFGQKAFFYLG